MVRVMKKFLVMTAAALIATTTMVSAATLSFVNNANEFDQLRVQGGAAVTYKVLSAEFTEDASENFLTVQSTNVNPGSTTLLSSNPIIGQTINRQINQGAGAYSILRFFMGSAVNSFVTNNTNGQMTGSALISFSAIFNGGKSVIAYFEMGDNADFGEMAVQIDVTEYPAVPVPAAGLLLLSGLGGLGLMSRRKKA